MNKNDFSRLVTSISRKTLIVLSGLILSLALLEVGLRLGGFVFSSIQGYENLRSAKQKGAYRILCLGESTTEGQYPHLLEQVLNQHHMGTRFSVIDKGKSATDSFFILSRVESYLAEYHPDMVVAMMGINDSGVRYFEDIPESDTWLFKHCRAYRFGRTLYMHLLNKLRNKDIYGTNRTDPSRTVKPEDARTIVKKKDFSDEVPSDKARGSDLKGREGSPRPRSPSSNRSGFSETEESLKKAIELNPENGNAYVELGRLYLEQGKFFQPEGLFKKAIGLNLNNDNAYVELGMLYCHQCKPLQARDFFKKALAINPRNNKAYTELQRLDREQGESPQAENFFKKAIGLNPKDDIAYVELGLLYLNQGKFPQAENSFKKAIEINPKNGYAYLGLGSLYRKQVKQSEAEDAFKKAIELNPENDIAYMELGQLYRSQEKYPQAEDLYKRAIKLDPENFNAYHGLGFIYLDQSKLSRAEECFKNAAGLNPRDDLYVQLGWLCLDQNKFTEAEDWFKKAIEIHPQNYYLYSAISIFYEKIRKPKLAAEYAQKVKELRFWNLNSVTVSNYHKLKEILDRKGIQLVCVQYPMRNLGPLKKIFENDKDVIFVDNERVFKEALRKGSYKEYFRDMFAGDFGHCTQKGNELLAQNITDVILREVFNKG
jgi:tetratricopeptide (TPR) repeat protein